jgi:thiol:disulfide interchange protein DsbA
MKVKFKKAKIAAMVAVSVGLLSACGQSETKEVAKVEVAKVEVAKVEVAKVEVAKVEVAKVEVAKVEVAKAESSEIKSVNTTNSVNISNKISTGLEVKEGVQYKKLETPIEFEGLADNSVLEIFWLGCPHCQNFESGVRDWKKTKYKDVQLLKVHAVSGNPRWLVDAHIYNSFVKLNASDQVLDGLFDLYIEQMKQYQTDTAADKNSKTKAFPEFKLITEYATVSGLDAKEFSAAFESDEVKATVKVAGDMFTKYKISGVPAFIVNKEYMITGEGVKSLAEYFEVIDKVAELTKK